MTQMSHNEYKVSEYIFSFHSNTFILSVKLRNSDWAWKYLPSNVMTFPQVKLFAMPSVNFARSFIILTNWYIFLTCFFYSLVAVPITTPKPDDPCREGTCSVNAKCRVEGTRGICTCIDGYFGNPYQECKPECLLSSDCPQYLACIKQKCADPCPGTCGINAFCEVVNHNPVCSCPRTMTGDPFSRCQESKLSLSFSISSIIHNNK